MQHTPGPWHRNVPPASKYPTIFAGQNTHVARLVETLPAEQVEGNANLISAAPELLDACRFLLERMQIFIESKMAEDEDILAAAAAMSAIEKAEGA